MKILVIEDEHKIARALKEGLEQESYAVDIAFDGNDGLGAALGDSYDLLIVDVMLPGKNGYDICRELRENAHHEPVLMLTARDTDDDIVCGLDTGADDYLAKPFSFEVLLARIRALLRRPQDSISNVLQAGDLTLDTVRKVVARSGKHISLSSKEFALLEYLLRNKNIVLSKETIIAHVWNFDANILPNTVEVFIAYLRNKIDRPFRTTPLITTIRGFGYKLAEPQCEQF